jgi:hypothetical protein
LRFALITSVEKRPGASANGWLAVEGDGRDGHLLNKMDFFERARTKIAGAEQHI